MDEKRQQVERILDNLPLAPFQKELALDGVANMDEAQLDRVIADHARIEEIMSRIFDKDGAAVG